MSHKKVVVEFLYDVVSPYSYLALEVLKRYGPRWLKMDLVLKPVFLGAIMAGSSNQPPLTNPAKGKYLHEDVRLLADYYQVNLRMASNFASGFAFHKGSLEAQRFLAALDHTAKEFGHGSDQKQLQQLSTRMFRYVFETQQLAKFDENLIKQMTNDVKLDDKLRETSFDKLRSGFAKDLLYKETEIALKNNVFGVPTMLVHLPKDQTQLFFGCDRIELLGHFLGEVYQGPVPK